MSCTRAGAASSPRRSTPPRPRPAERFDESDAAGERQRALRQADGLLARRRRQEATAALQDAEAAARGRAAAPMRAQIATLATLWTNRPGRAFRWTASGGGPTAGLARRYSGSRSGSLLRWIS